jgi:hypothetical protein
MKTFTSNKALRNYLSKRRYRGYTLKRYEVKRNEEK